MPNRSDEKVSNHVDGIRCKYAYIIHIHSFVDSRILPPTTELESS